MNLQELKIKYIPDIFPSMDFTSSVVIESYYMELPAITTIAKTEKKYATWYDVIKTQRKIQAARERRLRFEWITKERVDYDNILLADQLTVITDDNRTIELYNPTLSIEKINDYNNYKVSLEASIKELAQVATYRGSKKSQDRGSNNYIDFQVSNPIYVFSAFLWNDLQGHFSVTIDNSQFEQPLTIGDVYYWHSDSSVLNQEKEKYGKAEILSISGNTVTIGLDYNDYNSSDLSDITVQLDNFIEVQEVATKITPWNFRIYFDFEPDKKIILKNDKKITDGRGLEYNSHLQVQEILNLKFFLEESELSLLKYLYLANNISVTTSAGSYKVLQSPETIKQVDRNDIINLYEIDANFVIDNLTTTQL